MSPRRSPLDLGASQFYLVLPSLSFFGFKDYFMVSAFDLARRWDRDLKLSYKLGLHIEKRDTQVA